MSYTTITNSKEVMEKHPKFVSALRKWQIDKAIEGGAPKEVAEAQITDHFLELILTVTPRFLFDFFDEKGVFITIGYNDSFRYYIMYGDDQRAGGDYGKNRGEAEKEGFLKAIEIFENQ